MTLATFHLNLFWLYGSLSSVGNDKPPSCVYAVCFLTVTRCLKRTGTLNPFLRSLLYQLGVFGKVVRCPGILRLTGQNLESKTPRLFTSGAFCCMFYLYTHVPGFPVEVHKWRQRQKKKLKRARSYF